MVDTPIVLIPHRQISESHSASGEKKEGRANVPGCSWGCPGPLARALGEGGDTLPMMPQCQPCTKLRLPPPDDPKRVRALPNLYGSDDRGTSRSSLRESWTLAEWP